MNVARGSGYRIAENARLDARNTFGVRATAPMLVEASDAAALPELFGYAMLRDASTLVLGGGSNLLFAGDPPGAVLALDTRRIDLVEDHGDAATKQAAGALLVQTYTGLVYRGPALIEECVDALRRRKEAPSRGTLPPE